MGLLLSDIFRTIQRPRANDAGPCRSPRRYGNRGPPGALIKNRPIPGKLIDLRSNRHTSSNTRARYSGTAPELPRYFTDGPPGLWQHGAYFRAWPVEPSPGLLPFRIVFPFASLRRASRGAECRRRADEVRRLSKPETTADPGPTKRLIRKHRREPGRGFMKSPARGLLAFDDGRQYRIKPGRALQRLEPWITQERN